MLDLGLDPHASELARLQRQASCSPEPGTLEELQLLQGVDDARFEELASRRPRNTRRAQRFWRDRQRHLDGV